MDFPFRYLYKLTITIQCLPNIKDSFIILVKIYSLVYLFFRYRVRKAKSFDSDVTFRLCPTDLKASGISLNKRALILFDQIVTQIELIRFYIPHI